MWYRVAADCGTYRAGELLDIGDPEYALRLVWESGVQLEVVDAAEQGSGGAEEQGSGGAGAMMSESWVYPLDGTSSTVSVMSGVEEQAAPAKLLSIAARPKRGRKGV